MGYVRRYLEACTDEMLDRVLTAQEWCSLGFVNDDGARCLLGHAEDWRLPGAVDDDPGPVDPIPGDCHLDERVFDLHEGAFLAFDRLARRFGLPSAVVLVKGRAAQVLESRHPSPLSTAQRRSASVTPSKRSATLLTPTATTA